MKPTRRSFLKFIGASSAAAPIAAKSALDEEVARLTGVKLNTAPGIASVGSCAPPQSLYGGMSWDDLQIAASRYTTTFGVPDFILSQMRLNAHWVDRLDPDLAAKRSWSMSVKIATQRERNLQRMIDSVHHNAKRAAGYRALEKITGWRWPW